MDKYLAFDLEIAAILPEAETDWKAHRPLGITCVAMAWADLLDGSIVAAASYGRDGEGFGPRMSRDECRYVVARLQSFVELGYTLLTWNGCQFDFDVLAEESGMYRECIDLAMNHVDMMVQIHALKGYRLGLDAVSKGIGLAGKLEGVSGAKAPQMWTDGQFATVLDYVKQDARSTLEVGLKIQELGYLKWTSQKGRPNSLVVPRWLTVRECLALPEPDQSWMTNPTKRAEFTAWMTQAA